MTTNEHGTRQVVKLIGEARRLDLLDAKTFNRWVQESYGALRFDPSLQQTFDEYCRSSVHPASMRLFLGVWLLRQCLYAHGSDGRGVHLGPTEKLGPEMRKESVKVGRN